MKTIQVVTRDANLAQRVQEVLAHSNYNLVVSEDFPLVDRARDSVDLVIVDCLISKPYDIIKDVRSNPLWEDFIMIGLVVEIEYYSGYNLTWDVQLLRDFNPDELRILVPRLLDYTSIPTDGIYRI